MQHYTIVPIQPRLAPIRFDDLPLNEVLTLIQQLGFSEVLMVGPEEYFSIVSIDDAGAMHLTNHSVTTWPDIPSPSELN